MSGDAHPLDRPVWNALATRQRAFAQGGDLALRFAPRYGPFAACADARPESLAALAALDPGETGLRLMEAHPQPFLARLAPAMALVSTTTLVQMISPSEAGSDPEASHLSEVTALGDADAAEMRSLAALTAPGPFSTRTHRLAQFIGVRRDGVLVAMAGERLRPDGFAEVSGVCTHPDHRGRGWARALSRLVAQRIRARGETPFLHTYETNAAAIALYESLGFRLRATIGLVVVRPA